MVGGVYFASAEAQCRREKMEDFHTHSLIHLDKPYHVFLVVDGHGGDKVGRYVRDRLALYLEKRYKRGMAIKEHIENVFAEIDGKMRRVINDGSGAVVSLALLGDDRIFLAHLGDCTINYFNHDTNVAYESLSHSADEVSEQKRITDLNYHVANGRVEGILQPSRAFGDFYLKKSLYPERNPVSVVPTIVNFPRSGKSLIFLSTDGIFSLVDRSILTNWVVKNIQSKKHTLGEITTYLRRLAEDNKCSDNVSFFIIKDES